VYYDEYVNCKTTLSWKKEILESYKKKCKAKSNSNLPLQHNSGLVLETRLCYFGYDDI